jgi:hypothetical protein
MCTASLFTELVAKLKSTLLPSNLEVETFKPEAVFSEELVQDRGFSEPDALEQYTLDYILSTCDANLLEAFGDTMRLELDVDHTEENFEYGILEFPFK